MIFIAPAPVLVRVVHPTSVMGSAIVRVAPPATLATVLSLMNSGRLILWLPLTTAIVALPVFTSIVSEPAPAITYELELLNSINPRVIAVLVKTVLGLEMAPRKCASLPTAFGTPPAQFPPLFQSPLLSTFQVAGSVSAFPVYVISSSQRTFA